MRELITWLFRPDGATLVFGASVTMLAVILTMPLAPSRPPMEANASQPFVVPKPQRAQKPVFALGLSTKPRIAWEGR